MFEVAASLRAGFDSGEARLRLAQHALAEANAGKDTRRAGAAMATTAQATIFMQALLNAVHCRLAEIKAVTK